jgi:hypothetical protein
MTDKLISIKATLRTRPGVDVYLYFSRVHSGEVFVARPGWLSTGFIRHAFWNTGQGIQSLVGNMIDPHFRQLTENEWDQFCAEYDIRPAYQINHYWLPIRDW